MLHFRRPRSPALLVRRLAAGLLALTALVLAVRPDPAPARAGPAAVPVVVAARDLPPGTELTPGDLAEVRWPAGTPPDGVAAAAAELEGGVLAGPVRRGEPLTDVRLLGARVTDLLPAGLVAAPVRLADLAVSGLVAPGDRVDVLAAAPEAESAEVVAAGAVVLAAPGPVRPDAGTDPSAGLLLLAVEPATAARLAAVATSATLTVSLPGG
jgi:Flp pilus assembly protein CpaB